MKDWIPRIIILSLLAIILGIPFALRPAVTTSATGGGTSDRRDADRLIILTPHNEQIRYEIARAFNQWRLAQGRPPIEFDWRSSGGTADLVKQVRAEFEKAAISGQEEQGIGKDLFFGGGDFEHDRFARGIVTMRGGKQVTIPLTVPIELPAELVKAVFPEAQIGGVPLYEREMRWVGVVIARFGIIFNKELLGMLGATEPRTWSDLSDVRLRGWVALADPAHSGSSAATYNVILRRVGWTEGWATLRRVFANARYFTASAAKVPVDVSTGEAAAGMCIDFYGRLQAGAVGKERVGYVDPLYMTAATPDAISILRGAPHKALATELVVWLLSPDAQGLWQRRRGIPHGPERFELHRLPVRRDVYNPAEMKTWTDQVDPFATAKALPGGTPDFYMAVSPVVQAMAMDNSESLEAAWAALVEHSNHPRYGEMMQLFDALPPELTLTWPDGDLQNHWREIMEDSANPRHEEVLAVLKQFTDSLARRYNGWKDADKILADRLRWTRFFQDNYRRIAAELAR